MAYYIVKGQKVDGIIAQTKEQWEADYRQKLANGDLAQGMPGGSVSAPFVPQGNVTLTEDQKKAAAAFGITEADYVKNMKR
jgi:phage I-like protein